MEKSHLLIESLEGDVTRHGEKERKEGKKREKVQGGGRGRKGRRLDEVNSWKRRQRGRVEVCFRPSTTTVESKGGIHMLIH